MNFIIPKLHPATQKEFISFWESQYSHALEPLYETNIGKPLTEPRIWELFKWKNRGELSEKKKLAVRAYLAQLDRLPAIGDIASVRRYIEQQEGGPIWSIFWLHCISPNMFPIFDQHTYRAMEKIKENIAAEIPVSREAKIRIYFNNYIPFIINMGGISHSLDRALFTYGRFLKKGCA